MVTFERDGGGQTNDDVAEHTQNPVGHGTRMTEGQVVTDFVDGQSHGMIDGSAKDVGGQDD